jgi:hypothetical protein
LDPNDLSALNKHLVPEQTLLDDDIHFGQGAELIVDIPINPHGMYNIYLDNIINLTFNIPRTNHVSWGQAAALLAINATAWPNHPKEPIPQKSMDTMDTLMAEAGFTKMKIILGWDFNSGTSGSPFPRTRLLPGWQLSALCSSKEWPPPRNSSQQSDYWGTSPWLCREFTISSAVSENSNNWPPTDAQSLSMRLVRKI